MSPEASLELLNLPNIITSRWIGQLHERQRHYHTLAHIKHMLDELPMADASKELIAAIWLHDIVYDPHGFNNEALSAQQAQSDLRQWSSESRDRVVQLILGTKHHMPASDEQNLMNDLDLLILGELPHRYNDFAKNIRLEYAHVPDAQFNAARAQAMQRFLDRGRIYMTAAFAHYERQARMNITYEIKRLNA